ncbi:hypothetical protein BX666DRAFT_1969564 [Dichotomocladium elegans]|nr:hypothetical protein BX666DRAFT_1969564 [Dichotomocladium elegans]
MMFAVVCSLSIGNCSLVLLSSSCCSSYRILDCRLMSSPRLLTFHSLPVHRLGVALVAVVLFSSTSDGWRMSGDDCEDSVGGGVVGGI